MLASSSTSLFRRALPPGYQHRTMPHASFLPARFGGIMFHVKRTVCVATEPPSRRCHERFRCRPLPRADSNRTPG